MEKKPLIYIVVFLLIVCLFSCSSVDANETNNFNYLRLIGLSFLMYIVASALKLAAPEKGGISILLSLAAIALLVLITYQIDITIGIFSSIAALFVLSLVLPEDYYKDMHGIRRKKKYGKGDHLVTLSIIYIVFLLLTMFFQFT